MKLDQTMSAVVTGGASGLGLASAKRLVEKGVKVVIADISEERAAAALDALGPNATFVQADVTDTDQMTRVFDAAVAMGPLRALVHCAGLGGAVRVVEKDGSPGSLEAYERVVRINLIGTLSLPPQNESLAEVKLKQGEM
ncbi:putative oxidoreductase [Cupriavidus metallidurans]|jgi:NAD(P)-dependent dehydrogenase (short-subunit alcohol dehydrogenase family)|nr:SDR family NAD(P)-dependent oxidoreductase [Cupriavidus metallidurans]KWW32888.1 putative oxidoreductase [Cupriavidus metallidurans]